jgi:ketosteroid isomerase-like protein
MIRANSGRLLMTLALLLTVSACKPQSAQVDPAADNAAILAAAASFEKAYNDKNVDGVAAMYAEDAELMPPGNPMTKGRAAIRELYAKDIAERWARLTITTGASGASGDWGWRSGTWSVETTPAMTGKYLEVWRRTAEGWRMHRDIWNDDSPPAAAAEPAPAPST